MRLAGDGFMVLRSSRDYSAENCKCCTAVDPLLEGETSIDLLPRLPLSLYILWWKPQEFTPKSLNCDKEVQRVKR